jgi:predicted amidohydrolase YtcJ
VRGAEPVAVVVRRARLGAGLVELRLEGDRIAEMGERVRRDAHDVEIDAGGGTVIPGLHDHHLHVRAAAAALRSVPVGPRDVGNARGFAEALQAAARVQPVGHWVRAVGYHESVAGRLDSASLDAIVADRPVRVQHRSGSLWTVNSAGLVGLGVLGSNHPGIERGEGGRPTGRLWRMDSYLSERLGASVGFSSVEGPELGALSAEALAYGVTGWTDATPGRPGPEALALAEAVAAGEVGQRLHLMQPADTDEGTLAHLKQTERVTVGPVKVLLSDAELPSLEELAGWIGRAHEVGRPVAVHCVTRVQLVVTLAALEMAGSRPGDRVEHGAVVPDDLLAPIAAAGLVVVTQPNFVAERGDQYLSEVGATELPDLWRGWSLRVAGITVAAGTDAPFGSLDPWVAVRAATRRLTASGHELGSGEAVDSEEALRWWWGSGPRPGTPRRLKAGGPADLCVLAVPLAEALAGDGRVPVVATVVAGQVRFVAA